MVHKATTAAWMRGNPLFEPLCEEAANKLLDHCTVQTFTSGQRLIEQNGKNESLFLITLGKVKIVINGTEVDTQQAGESIGEISTSNISPPVADVIAITDVEVIVFPIETVHDLCNSNPDFAKRLRDTGMKKVYDR